MTHIESQAMNFCADCGGHLESGHVTHRDHSTPTHYQIIENVPALVCQQCGEYFLSHDVIDRLTRLTQENQPIRQVTTAFYDFNC